MARHEQDREDLLREATGLTRRIELVVEGFESEIVVGFRRSGCGSIYFGADPVVQFNTAGELRRGYRAGRLLKAESRQLVELTRERTADETSLVRRELAADEQTHVVAELRAAVERLREALDAGRFRVTGQVPADADLLSPIRAWLVQLSQPWTIARQANAT